MVEVRTYILRKDGELEAFSILPLDHYGTCPNVGDTVCHSWQRDRPTVYSVQRRYFIDNHDHRHGWAIVIREIETSAQANAVAQAWYDDDDFNDELDAKEAAEEARRHEQVAERLALLTGRPPVEINLNKREEGVVKTLSKRGVGTRLACRAISDFGSGTRDALRKRGLINVHAGGGGMFRDDEVSLTADGARVFKALKAYRKKVEAARARPTG